jgi:hypothetical protein
MDGDGLLIGVALFALASSALAWTKGHSPIKWAIYGALGGPFALAKIFVTSATSEEILRRGETSEGGP